MRKNLWTRLGVVISAGFLLAACGDNILPGGDDGPDASLIDADDVPPDAEIDGNGPTATIGGTLAVFDATLTDPSAALVGGVRGGAIRMSFNDLTTNGGEVVFAGGAEAPIGSCLIQQFDADSLPNPRLDAGPITVSGPASGTSALLKTVGPCTLQAAFGDPDPYMCISNNEATATAGAQDLATNSLVVYTLALPALDLGTSPSIPITATARVSNVVTVTTAVPHGLPPGISATLSGVTSVGATSFNGRFTVTSVPTTTTFTFSQTAADDTGTGGGATVPTFAIVGSALVINGFSNAAFNSGAGAFPIVSQLDGNTVVVINSAPANGAAAAPGAVAYTILNGASPVPGAGSLANFLGGALAPETASIRIQKAQNSVWPAIDFTVDVPGEAPPPAGIATIARAGNTVTVTTAAAHNFNTGPSVTIAGVLDASFNGTFTILTAPTATTFTYAQTAADAASTGGRATKTGFILDAGSQAAHVFPTTTAAAINYSCDNDTAGVTTDDTCGDESTTTLKAMIISGSATKKPVAAIFPFQMPTETPGSASAWLEWQCAFLLSKSADMPAAAVQEIIDFGPTRIEQQILFVAGTILDDGGGLNQMRVLSGHALAGHQTFCPAAAAIPAASIATVSRASNVVTVTTSAPHGFMPGQTVTLAGVTDTSFNGTGVITSTPVGNGVSVTFTFAQTDADATSTGGTATVPAAATGFGTPVCPACNDGIDNDGDTMIDLLDSNCTDANDTSEAS